ncbi:DUF1648 domain-containing protein [Ornithinibacillus sp. L9]|uniref:DUF1648 domain-containing protein n=1 Tax=Ornithinibacillus caprae TaxID=2678566 RepID=A0A6N8FJ66_9BACI|nr:DUF5808 domain-containing protein [Ornithinibacillus caprae]MUK88334.1 DUF1648 domain-containing protein [Ornithinibacillus caprae]
MNNTVLFLLVLVLLPVFISTMFIPYWTRKSESFGVSIPESLYSSKKLKQMRKEYVLQTGILSFITASSLVLLTAFFEITDDIVSIYFASLTLFYIVISFLIYLTFHRRMKQIKHEDSQYGSKQSQMLVIDTSFRQQKLTYSNLWFTISFLIAITTMLITLQNYHHIPKRIPMQYNFSGEVTNWTNKSYRSVLILPIMQVYLTLLFIFINKIIAKAKQQVSAVNPEDSKKRNIIFRRRWSAYLITTSIALTAMLSIIQLSFIYPINQQFMVVVPLVFSLVITLGAIWLSITTGQGGSRVITHDKDEAEKRINRDDDKYWKLGVFYFNKNDPSLFLEKRFGVGWTNNWANPLSWIIIIVIILLAAGIPFILST